MKKNWLEKFENPGCELRGAPFWAWNSKLEKKELVRQIQLMHKMGIGGFFMHARVGLGTEYLGKEWFDCVKACIAEAKKLKMQAWLYDEDRWPSGAAGGIVTKDLKYRQRIVSIEELDSLESSDGKGTDVAWYAAVIDGAKMKSYRRLIEPGKAKLKKGEKFLRFKKVILGPHDWFNGQNYLDVLSPDAVQKFIETTHEAYKKHISKEFGKTVPGIFTDEPAFGHGSQDWDLPWTDRLPEKFKKRFGTDILDKLPELVYETENESEEVRWQYYEILTSMFVNSFSRMIGEWCGKNNLMFTGHVLQEDTLRNQGRIVGSAMRFYEFQQQPGIDLLTEHWNIFNTAKQCSSAAHQFGRQHRLSETYGCTGWDFPLMGHKALGDWQFACGINLRCMHLAWYSMSGEAKRDYPASISYQSPWFNKYPVVEDYFARIHAILTDGEEIRDLLMIHPVESVWSMVVRNKQTDWSAVEAFDRKFAERTNELLGAHLDFDFGDEEIMSRHASVKNGKLQVGKASYQAVLVPELKTIRKTTLDILVKFAKAGGTVYAMGKAPARMNGALSGEPAKVFASFRKVSEAGYLKKISADLRILSVADEHGNEIKPVLSMLYKKSSGYALFLCNTSMDFSSDIFSACLVRDRKQAFPEVSVVLSIPESGTLYELDPKTGKIFTTDAVYRNGAYRLTTSFPPLGSRLFFITKDKVGKILPEAAEPEFSGRKYLGSKNWQITLDEPNVYVLDHVKVSSKLFSIKEPEYCLFADQKLRKALGERPRGGHMIQPWLRGEKKPGRILPLDLEYAFQCSYIPAEGVLFAIEHPEYYIVKVNGKVLKTDVERWWTDIVIGGIRIPAKMLKKGDNRICLHCDYHADLPGLESCFLLGNFGVQADKLVQPVDSIECGDWCRQGFPFYAGNLSYRKTVKAPVNRGKQRVWLSVPEWRGTALGISINGSEEILLPWPPFRTDVTELIHDGDNDVVITVYGHRRNAFGPFYLKTKWPGWTGPKQFLMYERKTKNLVPCGLLKSPVFELEK